MINVKGHSDDQGLTYQAEMSFHYRPSGWDATATYISRYTGQPPGDAVISTVKASDNTFPQYAGNYAAGTPDIGQTLAATADESTFPSFGAGNTQRDIPRRGKLMMEPNRTNQKRRARCWRCLCFSQCPTGAKKGFLCRSLLTMLMFFSVRKSRLGRMIPGCACRMHHCNNL